MTHVSVVQVSNCFDDACNCELGLVLLERPVSFHQSEQFTTEENFGQQVDVFVVAKCLVQFQYEFRVDFHQNFSLGFHVSPLTCLNYRVFIDALQCVLLALGAFDLFLFRNYSID